MLLLEILVETVNRGYWYFPPTGKLVPVGKDKYGDTLHVDILHDQPELFGLSPEDAGKDKPAHLSQSQLARKIFDAGWVRVRSFEGREGSWISIEGTPAGLKHVNVQRLIMRQKKDLAGAGQEFAVFLDALDTKTGRTIDSEHFGLNQPSDIFKMNRWLERQ